MATSKSSPWAVARSLRVVRQPARLAKRRELSAATTSRRREQLSIRDCVSEHSDDDAWLASTPTRAGVIADATHDRVGQGIERPPPLAMTTARMPTGMRTGTPHRPEPAGSSTCSPPPLPSSSASRPLPAAAAAAKYPLSMRPHRIDGECTPFKARTARRSSPARITGNLW
jgi:hypothetical protein